MFRKVFHMFCNEISTNHSPHLSSLIQCFLLVRRVARNLSWEGELLRGSGDGAPSRRRLGVWALSEARGSEGSAPSARQFLQFFNENNAFLDIFRLKFLL